MLDQPPSLSEPRNGAPPFQWGHHAHFELRSTPRMDSSGDARVGGKGPAHPKDVKLKVRTHPRIAALKVKHDQQPFFRVCSSNVGGVAKGSSVVRPGRAVPVSDQPPGPPNSTGRGPGAAQPPSRACACCLEVSISSICDRDPPLVARRVMSIARSAPTARS